MSVLIFLHYKVLAPGDLLYNGNGETIQQKGSFFHDYPIHSL